MQATFEAAHAVAEWAWGGVGDHNAAARSLYGGLAEDIGQVIYRRAL